MTTHAVMILDKSGSMAGVRAEAIGGFNAYLETLKASPEAENTLLTLTLFDSGVRRPIVREPVARVLPLDSSRYQPCGRTALYDAIILTLQLPGLGQLPPGDRVLVIILTDGQENASQLCGRVEVEALIRSRETEGGWTFIYLSASPDAFKDGREIGIADSNTYRYLEGPTGTRALFEDLNQATASYLSSPATAAGPGEFTAGWTN